MAQALLAIYCVALGQSLLLAESISSVTSKADSMTKSSSSSGRLILCVVLECM